MDKKMVQKIVDLYKNGDLSKKSAVELLKGIDEVEEIAIIGMGCVTPLSDDYKALWDTMVNRRNHVRPCPKQRINLTSKYLGEGADSEELYHYGAFYEDYAMCDYKLYGLTKEDATLMDPMQRIMLKSAYRTLEDAGYLGNRKENDTTGVLIGANFTNKQFFNYLSLIGEANFETIMANWTSGIATRISNCFDLRGISTVIENSCIASIMAMSDACNLLRTGKLSSVLVGAVSTILIPDKRISLNSIFAHDNNVVSKPYDDNPGGNYVGEGAVSLLLKPLSKAIEDGDKIHGIIKSSCVNNNGGTSLFTQSNAEMIGEVVKSAFQEAKIQPDELDYIEGEGYCDKIEQALEVNGLTKGIRNFTDKKQFCALGAASANIGYSEAAVGIFNTICCILAIKNKKIPPIYSLDKPSDLVDFCNSPFYINDCVKEWKVTDNKKRMAGVFTQGFGGGNGFTILQEYTNDRIHNDSKNAEEKPHLFLLSALTKKSFNAYIENYLTFLASDKNESLFGEICFTAATKRKHYLPYRIAVIATSKQDLYCQLENFNGKNTNSLFVGEAKEKNRRENKNILSEVKEAITIGDYKKIAQFYVDGYQMDLTELFETEEQNNVDLPLYPLDSEECWI